MNKIIDEAWEDRASLNPAKAPRKLRAAVKAAIEGLDRGELRVAEKLNDKWVTHQWL